MKTLPCHVCGTHVSAETHSGILINLLASAASHFIQLKGQLASISKDTRDKAELALRFKLELEVQAAEIRLTKLEAFRNAPEGDLDDFFK